MHLGIIMDGNRRWAKERGLQALDGHKQGAENARKIARHCKNRGIKFLTLYAFSTENWQREPLEVNLIMRLFGSFLDKWMEELRTENVKLLFIGQRERLLSSLRKKMGEAEYQTRKNNDLTLILAVSYGGREEIASALKRMIKEGVSPEDVSEENIGNYLYTAGLPNPDIIIRTSGEIRTSGFLLWQSAYSELYFTEKYWPDFSEDDLDKALEEYTRRQRRFGK